MSERQLPKLLLMSFAGMATSGGLTRKCLTRERVSALMVAVPFRSLVASVTLDFRSPADCPQGLFSLILIQMRYMAFRGVPKSCMPP
jgi:hypothetical protein